MMKTLFGAGGVGLVAAATGLPVSFLRTGRAKADPGAARFLVLMANSRGDSFNCNAPGSYGQGFQVHPGGEEFAGVDLQLGESTARGARVWEGLPMALRSRAAFVHHATRTIVHPDLPKVLRLQGETQGGISIPELIARENATALDTVQGNPLPLGNSDTFVVNGAPLPKLKPTALKALLVADADAPLARFAEIRNRNLDRIYAALRESGNQEQLRFLDNMAQARTEAAMLGESAGALLADIEDDSAASQAKAAIALIQLRVAPVMGVNFPFSGDNHTDPDFEDEVEEHAEGIAAIATLFAEAESAGVANRMTFASLNVFGRTMRQVANGRSHNPAHSVSLVIGPETKGGVYGGVEAGPRDNGVALAFDSTNGRVTESGDVTYDNSLASMGKTIACAAGVAPEVFNREVLSGVAVSGIFES